MRMDTVGNNNDPAGLGIIESRHDGGVEAFVDFLNLREIDGIVDVEWVVEYDDRRTAASNGALD